MATSRIGILLAALVVASSVPVSAASQEFRDSIEITLRDEFAAERLGVGPPLLRIGDGSPSKQFWNVAGVFLQADSSVLVVDGGSRELRTFGPSGELRRQFSGEGGGPGEFASQPWAAWQVGESVVVVDAARRAHVFRVDGRFVERRRPLVSKLGTRMRRLGFFADGDLVARYFEPPSPQLKDTATVLFHVVSVRQGTPTRLITTPGYVVIGVAGRQPPRVVYSPRLQVVVRADGFCVSFPAEYEIECYTRDGEGETRTHSSLRSSRRVGPAEREQYFVGLEKANPGPSGVVDRARRSSVFAERLPALGRLVASPSGELWVSSFVASEETLGTFNPSPSGETRWDIFGRDGRLRAMAILPAGFRLMSVRGGLVAGVQRDSYDVEYVVVLPLVSRGS